MGSAEVRKIITINGCQNNVVKTPLRNGSSNVFGFLSIIEEKEQIYSRIERSRRSTRFSVTELASTCASITHKHNSGSSNSILAAPALTNIGAFRLLTNSSKLQLTDGFQQMLIILARRQFCFQPRRKSLAHLLLLGIRSCTTCRIDFSLVNKIFQIGTILQIILNSKWKYIPITRK